MRTDLEGGQIGPLNKVREVDAQNNSSSSVVCDTVTQQDHPGAWLMASCRNLVYKCTTGPKATFMEII